MAEYEYKFNTLGDIGYIESPDGIVRFKLSAYEKVSMDECVPYVSIESQYKNKSGVWTIQWKKSKGQRTDVPDKFSIRVDMLDSLIRSLISFAKAETVAVLNDGRTTYHTNFAQLLQRQHMVYHERANSEQPAPKTNVAYLPAPTSSPSSGGSSGGGNQSQQGNYRQYPSTGTAPTAPIQTPPTQSGPPSRGYDPYGANPKNLPTQEEFPMDAGDTPDPF